MKLMNRAFDYYDPARPIRLYENEQRLRMIASDRVQLFTFFDILKYFVPESIEELHVRGRRMGDNLR